MAVIAGLLAGIISYFIFSAVQSAFGTPAMVLALFAAIAVQVLLHIAIAQYRLRQLKKHPLYYLALIQSEFGDKD